MLHPYFYRILSVITFLLAFLAAFTNDLGFERNTNAIVAMAGCWLIGFLSNSNAPKP